MDIAAGHDQVNGLAAQDQISEKRIEPGLRCLLRGLYALFSDNGYLPQTVTTATHTPGESNPFYSSMPISSHESFDHSPILADKRFHNILIQKWWVNADAQSLLDQADHSLDVSIQLIEKRLEQLGP